MFALATPSPRGGHLHACAAPSAGVLSQPGSEVDGTAEIQQGLCQGLELLQLHGLDAGGGGVGQGAAAAVEQAQGDGGFSERTATGLPFLPAAIQKDLGGAGVEQQAVGMPAITMRSSGVSVGSMGPLGWIEQGLLTARTGSA